MEPMAEGMTVVGFDPRVGPPPIVGGAILIDFNEKLQFPVLWPHVPLEFAFLFADRIAFWHADLLVRMPVMRQLAEHFASLHDGEMSAVFDSGGLKRRSPRCIVFESSAAASPRAQVKTSSTTVPDGGGTSNSIQNAYSKRSALDGVAMIMTLASAYFIGRITIMVI